MRRASSEEKTTFLAALSRWNPEYCIMMHPFQMTSICPNKRMMMFPLITSLTVNFYMKGWINEWKLEQNTYAWSRIPHLWLPKTLNQMSLRTSSDLTSNTNLVWFCAPQCEVHSSLVTWEFWHKLTAFQNFFFTVDERKFTVHRSLQSKYPHRNTFGTSLSLFLQSCQDQSRDSVKFRSSAPVRCNPIVLLSNR